MRPRSVACRTNSWDEACYLDDLAARFLCVGLALAVASPACRPIDAPTAEPTVAADTAPEEAEVAAFEEAEAPAASAPSLEGAFVITLASQCHDTWNGMLVVGDEHKAQGRPTASGWEPGGFEIRKASNRDLFMRRGDSLLLTNPRGGIMALRFDSLTAGYGALVEVTPECSGVHQTVVRAGSPR